MSSMKIYIVVQTAQKILTTFIDWLAQHIYWKPSTELPELIMFWLGWIALAKSL